MSSLGKVIANFFSAANENTLALASLKFDFSLIKLEAPAEFTGFGEALSTRRRHDAEDGVHHKTARRLAAMFEQLIPSTPKLITAYGLRSSEIIQTPGISPRASPHYGPFQNFVGADGTAMWAAATSGIPALGVYLLACLLARAWDAKEAISIWVELVKRRRDEIEENSKSNHAVSESTRMSVYQEVSRDDLARWDASARAWLQSADQVKVKEQTQLMLIIKNIVIPFNGGVSTYRKVVQAWQQAMSGLENLLCGRPQEISNRSILLAFSAWHLYPNLIVLGNEIRKVEFNDRYVHSQGIGTIALGQRSEKISQGTNWSLALSHLQYYGGPVTVTSYNDFSRVTIQQLHIIALGSIFYAWDVSQRNVLMVAQWFTSLWDFLCLGASQDALDGLAWLGYLAQAAKNLIHAKQHDDSEVSQLLAYGQRRGKRFLGGRAEPLEPFFGLAKESILESLSEKLDEERGVAFLRAIARTSGWRSSDAYIGCDLVTLAGCQSVFVREYMTAVSHTCRSKKRNFDGNTLTESVHSRWLHVESRPQLCHALDSKTIDSAIRRRLGEIADRGEVSMETLTRPQNNRGDWVWRPSPFLFDYEEHSRRGLSSNTGTDSFSCPSINNPSLPCRCFDCDVKPAPPCSNPSKFSPIYRIGTYSLYVRDDPQYRESKYPKKMTIRGEEYLHPNMSLAIIWKTSIEADVLSTYLQCVTNPWKQCSSDTLHPTSENDDEEDEEVDADSYCNNIDRGKQEHERLSGRQSKPTVPCTQAIAEVFPMSYKRARALIALALATQVYLNLEGATISLKVVDTPLGEAPWIPRRLLSGRRRIIGGNDAAPSKSSASLKRQNTLGCIAHFESGTLLLQPDEFDQTLAIASGNSIFVISLLLSDPFDRVPENRVKRIVGNIGHTGVCLLVAPVDPQIRPLGNQYNLVQHAVYDGRREDNFKATSLHLSFTDWTLPIETTGSGARTIDQEACFVESVISVFDSGKWVADLDILSIDFRNLRRLEMTGDCSGHVGAGPGYDYTSLDSWEELLDDPTNVAFFRARGNWAARLAAVSILSQKGQDHSFGLLGPEKFCLQCLNEDEYGDASLKEFESPLPSVCID